MLTELSLSQCSIQTFSDAKTACRYMFYNFSDTDICKFYEVSQCIVSLDTSLEMIKDVNYHIFNVERDRVLLPPFQQRDVSSDKDIQHQLYLAHIAEHF